MKKTRYKKMVRQGDVLVMAASPKVAADQIEPETKDARGLVLAEGESSGHHHQLYGRGAKLYRFRDGSGLARVAFVGRAGGEMVVIGGGSGAVARHHPIALAGGRYLQITQRQWTAEDEARSRPVAD